MIEDLQHIPMTSVSVTDANKTNLESEESKSNQFTFNCKCSINLGTIKLEYIYKCFMYF